MLVSEQEVQKNLQHKVNRIEIEIEEILRNIETLTESTKHVCLFKKLKTSVF